MLSETLNEGLKTYGIGQKIRGLRLKKSMGLAALGAHTGLSPAMLSKIERGRLYPTLPTLLRVALVFSVGLDYFFDRGTGKPAAAVVRKKDRIRLPDTPAGEPSFHFESLDFPIPERRLSGYLAEFSTAPDGRPRTHEHPGAELIYVLTGTLLVTIGEDEYVLAPGDSMYFDSSATHAYRGTDGDACTALVVVADGR